MNRILKHKQYSTYLRRDPYSYLDCESSFIPGPELQFTKSRAKTYNDHFTDALTHACYSIRKAADKWRREKEKFKISHSTNIIKFMFPDESRYSCLFCDHFCYVKRKNYCERLLAIIFVPFHITYCSEFK